MTSSTARIRRWWTDDEDTVLRAEAELQLKTSSEVKDWNRVAAKLPGRTNKDCRKRWSKIKEDVKKGAWTSAEDKKLQKAVQHHGFRWTDVAKHVGSRHADQCAKRWQHYLDPKIDHSEWRDPADDERLVRAVKMYGRDWKHISEQEFPTRSPTDLKNRHSIVERRMRSQLSAQVESSRSPPVNNTMDVEQESEESSDFEQDDEDPSQDDHGDGDMHQLALMQSRYGMPSASTPGDMLSPFPTNSQMSLYSNGFDFGLGSYGDMTDTHGYPLYSHEYSSDGSVNPQSTTFLGDPNMLAASQMAWHSSFDDANSMQHPQHHRDSSSPGGRPSSSMMVDDHFGQMSPSSSTGKHSRHSKRQHSQSSSTDYITGLVPNMTLGMNGADPSKGNAAINSIVPSMLGLDPNMSPAALRAATMRATLTLDDVAPDTLQGVLQVLMERKTRVQIHFPQQ